jgi:predicted patatin/cPLA2 family phospholipase
MLRDNYWSTVLPQWPPKDHQGPSRTVKDRSGTGSIARRISPLRKGKHKIIKTSEQIRKTYETIRDKLQNNFNIRNKYRKYKKLQKYQKTHPKTYGHNTGQIHNIDKNTKGVQETYGKYTETIRTQIRKEQHVMNMSYALAFRKHMFQICRFH